MLSMGEQQRDMRLSAEVVKDTFRVESINNSHDMKNNLKK